MVNTANGQSMSGLWNSCLLNAPNAMNTKLIMETSFPHIEAAAVSFQRHPAVWLRQLPICYHQRKTNVSLQPTPAKCLSCIQQHCLLRKQVYPAYLVLLLANSLHGSRPTSLKNSPGIEKCSVIPTGAKLFDLQTPFKPNWSHHLKKPFRLR